MRDYGTHNYVGTLACGCGVAIVADMPDFKKDTAEEVAKMIVAGYVVQRLPHTEAATVFSFECADYPHEPWQQRNEAARIQRLSKLPLSPESIP